MSEKSRYFPAVNQWKYSLRFVICDVDGGKGHYYDDFDDYPNLFDFPYVRSHYGEYFQWNAGCNVWVIPGKKDMIHLPKKQL